MPAITLLNTRSRYFPQKQQPRRGWLGIHPRNAWPDVNLPSNMGGFSLPITVNPPPAPPKLDVILITGLPATDCIFLGHHLAQDLAQGYVHLNIFGLLKAVDDMPDGEEKTQALGELHPLALKTFIENVRTGQKAALSPRLIIDVLHRRINHLVQHNGKRKFIVSGFVAWREIIYFKTQIAEPEAVVLINRDYGENMDVKGWVEGHFGRERTVVVERGEDGTKGLKDIYAEVLAEFGRKAMQGNRHDEEVKKEDETSGEVERRQHLQDQVRHDGLKAAARGEAFRDAQQKQQVQSSEGDVEVWHEAIENQKEPPVQENGEDKMETDDDEGLASGANAIPLGVRTHRNETIQNDSSSTTTLDQERVDTPLEDDEMSVSFDLMKELDDWAHRR